MIYKEFNSLVRFLKKEYSLSGIVAVRRTTKIPKGMDGDCRRFGDKFVVRINKKLPEFYAIDVLVHEISHCLAWDEDDFHSEQWGKTYSRVYKKFLEWNDS